MHFNFLSTICLLALSGLGAASKRAVARTLNIVAHQDDDLLFQNPDIIHDIGSGRRVRTVYLTAGDAGRGWEYWTSRQAGAMAAYAEMAGVSNDWEESDLGIPGKDIPLYTLSDRQRISIAFMHLPDGSIDGNGFPSTDNESMEKLWKESIPEIRTVDESGTTYTRQELIDTLTTIIDDFGPDDVNALDYLHDFGTGDHSDHTAGGLFANEAAIPSEFPGNVIAYIGYPTSDLPANVDGEDLEEKKAAFYTYAAYDDAVCSSDEACAGGPYESWLARLYNLSGL
ncbi:uncharacterized protein ACLA_077650 [Aspergillus clavatus NRRL 1]|uniref:N-acetylglucosaminylphosphatidylinositol deacetylase n=1 Tax=Aspergillus clavatus (strain ATCC 1007 / CBS 513.65 / DSM 816 / NCTC 3887 / NRRL 1 / QM 1276 / 107) TaxID=344612 RepID=A1CLN9_ASPCL|nr:uncharacterized protein ACLA_077650 [Aspergillus clavatus NRRL 1]EAW09018.1 conserved hypothetical protein [Aspergillus clavatus NRRL 1]